MIDSKQAIIDYYRRHGSNWSSLYETKTKSAVLIRMNYALEFAKSIDAKAILDAGCGTGSFVHLMRSEGFQCDGMDLSPDMLRSAHELCITLPVTELTGRLVEGDLSSSSDYPGAAYNLITAFGVFVHEIDEPTVLSNFRSKLAANGRVIISFRNMLFSLFTLNEHTLTFYRSLTSGLGLSEEDLTRIGDYFQRSCTNGFGASRPGGDEFKSVFHKFHNPLEMPSYFESHGFEVEDIYYLNFHPAPPQALDKVRNQAEVIRSMEESLARSWRGNFLASSFLVRARVRP